MTTVISFIIVLGFLILIHELGHFLAARKLGVTVEKFSIGFGPRLIGFKKGDTEYMISAFPLGGYVKLLGEEPGEELKNDPGEFGSRPVLHRMAIIIAGPLMNLALAFIVFPIVFMVGVSSPAFLDKEVRVGWVMDGSPAKEAGIQPGDLIISEGGTTLGTWEKAMTLFITSPGRKLSLEILRGDTIVNVNLTPTFIDGGGGYTGIIQPMEPRVGGVSPGLPADKAGLEKGDLLVSINGQKVTHWVQMSGLIKQSGGNTLTLGIERGREYLDVKLTPIKNVEGGDYIIGVSFKQPSVLKKFGPLSAVREGIKRAFDLTYLTFDVVKRLVTLDLSIKTLGGPIMIAQATGAAAESGTGELLSLLAFISLQLGILNLLPIPVLDGGHVFFLLAEMALRRPVSIKTREIAQQVGFAILIALMLVVSYNDILRIIPL